MDDGYIAKHARPGESWDQARARLKREAAKSKPVRPVYCNWVWCKRLCEKPHEIEARMCEDCQSQEDFEREEELSVLDQHEANYPVPAENEGS